MIKWEELPDEFKNEDIRKYYDILESKKKVLVFKRVFDLLFSIILILLFLPLLILIGVVVLIDSKGPAIYKQKRVTRYNTDFYIFKFRTMVEDADKIGSLVTVDKDSRITRVGRFLRKYRFDELPQLFNILKGEMSFVGTRPEVRKYVDIYSTEMMATLLLPAGVTSLASINYKDEQSALSKQEDADWVYTNVILPAKMKYNLNYLKNFSIKVDVMVLINTIVEVFLN